MPLSPEFLDNPQVKDCCKREEHLAPHEVRPDLTVMRCAVCGCRHFELTVDPLVLKLRSA